MLQRQVRVHPLELGVFSLELPQLSHIRHRRAPVLAPPLEECRLADAVRPSQVRHGHAALGIPQDANDLGLTEPRLSHDRSLDQSSLRSTVNRSGKLTASPRRGIALCPVGRDRGRGRTARRAGKSTLLRIVAAHDDNVSIGSTDRRQPGDVKPGLVRGWRFCDPWDIFAPEWRPEEWCGMPILRYAFPNMALDGSARQPPGCYGASHVDSDGVVHSPPPWQGPPPNDDDLPDLLLVDDLVDNPAFADAAARCAFVRDLHGLRLRPEYRTVIYATRDGEDALAVADRIAVLRDGRIVQCGTPAEVHDPPVNE